MSHKPDLDLHPPGDPDLFPDPQRPPGSILILYVPFIYTSVILVTDCLFLLTLHLLFFNEHTNIQGEVKNNVRIKYINNHTSKIKIIVQMKLRGIGTGLF